VRMRRSAADHWLLGATAVALSVDSSPTRRCDCSLAQGTTLWQELALGKPRSFAALKMTAGQVETPFVPQTCLAPLRSVQNDMASGFLVACLLPEAIPWAKVGSALLTLPSGTRDRRDDDLATVLFSVLPALDKRSVFWYNGCRIGNLNQ
jgi:hypothetical protein